MTVSLIGLVDVHLDLKHIEVAAINECDGKFAIDGPIAPSVDGVSAALLEEPLRMAFESVVQQLGPILCFGSRHLALHNVEEGTTTRIGGLVSALNAALRQHPVLLGTLLMPLGGDPVRSVLAETAGGGKGYAEIDREAVALAREDIAKLRSVGVVKRLGEGRFANIVDADGDGVYHLMPPASESARAA